MKPVKLALISLLIPLVLNLVGCAFSQLSLSGGETTAEKIPTLADLQPAQMPDTSKTLPAVDLDTLVSTYRDVLSVTDDPGLRLQVMQRLAGLEMKRGEQLLYEQETVGGQFDLAIESYQALLKQNPHSPDSDRLLYQLSKAHDLSGNTNQSMAVLDTLVTQFPNSPHYSEAQFRRAEIFFARGDYRSAEQAYSDVIKYGKAGVHYPNALYMHGWSQFKLERYLQSLASFTAVLDLNIPPDNDLESLSRGQRELTKDTFRIMSVVFSYLDGPQTIAEVYNDAGERHYMPLLYDNLGKLYLEKERFKDSAEAYRAYVDRYPQSDQAPVFYASLIDAYLSGGFSEDVLLEKERYVNLYGIRGEYWPQKSEASRDYIRPFLEKYLPELAKHFHARAQEKTAVLTGTAISSAADKTSLAATDATTTSGRAEVEKSRQKSNKPLTSKQRTELQQAAIAQYLQAGNYYQEFMDTFPEDDQVPEMHFLLAESRFEAQVYDQAIAAYEIVAYKYPDHKRGAVAGYAAIIAYGRLLESLPDAEANQQYEYWLRLKIGSQLRFANTFQNDPHATAVLTKSAEELLALREYQQALEAATQLVNREPPAENSLRKTAWLVIGHSEFELQHYAQAETAYQQTLTIIASSDPTRPAIVERLAASVYKQAETALAAGDPIFAAQEFLRVAVVAPTSSISVTAKYDAANTMMDAASWGSAIAVLNSFRKEYPNHPLTADIPAKIVVAYQQDGQWARAADELTAIFQKSDDELVKKESLYQAAELYEKAGDTASAIERYREYAHAYPDPFPIAMEARFKLSELYLQTGDEDKRRFWLKKMIDADQSAGKLRTDRSHYLAAMSSSVFADDNYRTFSSIQLTLPLKSSLKRKKQALNKVLSSYQSVADYGVAEFATLATYRIGEIYRQLSGDLMDSQRPANLDELALEQYELLLEEQAFPFEEKAIAIHEANSQRSWEGVYDQWIKESFNSLKKLLPARYGKEERGVEFSDDIY